MADDCSILLDDCEYIEDINMPRGPLYNNNEYRNLITEFFGEIFYLPGLSYGTKVQKLRQYTEIILRRLLNYPCNSNIEIGNDRTIANLDSRGFTEPLFRDSLERIRATGNERNHTKYRRVATEEEYREILDSVFNLYGYLFYRYFKKWPFGTNTKVMSAFSCLPPIIRHITLTALYDDDPNNQVIVDKLVLAKLKAFDKDTADAWIEAHKESLLSMSVPADSDYLKKLISAVGEEAAVALVAAMPDNMYRVCKEKIQTVDAALDSKPLYSDFETAKNNYEKNGIVDGSSQEIAEFNDLMEFVYIGRRNKEREIAAIPEANYIISQIIVINPELWGLGNN